MQTLVVAFVMGVVVGATAPHGYRLMSIGLAFVGKKLGVKPKDIRAYERATDPSDESK